MQSYVYAVAMYGCIVQLQHVAADAPICCSLASMVEVTAAVLKHRFHFLICVQVAVMLGLLHACAGCQAVPAELNLSDVPYAGCSL